MEDEKKSLPSRTMNLDIRSTPMFINHYQYGE